MVNLNFLKSAVIAVSLIAIFFFTVVGVTEVFGTKSTQNGIHIISDNAVYLAGESCTISASLDRENNDILLEANACVQLHSAYRTLRFYDQENSQNLVAEKQDI